MEFAQVLLFIYSLTSGEQIATVRLDQKITIEQCRTIIPGIVKQMADKAPIVLYKKVRVVGECRKVP